MKKICLILLLLPFLQSEVKAQDWLEFRFKAFNWGAKLGCNATFPVVNSLEVDGIQAENIQLKYRVGWQASAFARINIEKFFIEPTLSWMHTESDIHFTFPSSSNNGIVNGITNVSPENVLNYSAKTLHLPIMVGYYLVKEAPYAFSIAAGPSVRYNVKTHYETHMSETAREYNDDSTPFGVAIAAGLGVTIGRLFLNFNYEFGLNEVGSTFHTINNGNTDAGNNGTLTIDKRTHLMSFALGFLF